MEDDISIKEEVLLESPGKKVDIKKESEDFNEMRLEWLKEEKIDSNDSFSVESSVDIDDIDIKEESLSLDNSGRKMDIKEGRKDQMFSMEEPVEMKKIIKNEEIFTWNSFEEAPCPSNLALRSVETYECSICSEQFSDSNGLKGHIATHIKKIFECEVCKAKFAYVQRLKTHMRTHTGEKPFECEVCKAKFARSQHLTLHMSTHTGERPFECEVCNAKFTQAQSLKVHMRTHTGEKPYKCDFCEAKFAQSSTLKTHMRTHTGEKPFECVVCNLKFKQQSHLRYHSMRLHKGE